MGLEAEKLDPPDGGDEALEREIASVRTLAGSAAEAERVDESTLGQVQHGVNQRVGAETGVLATMRGWPTWQRLGMVILLSAVTTVATAVTMPRWDLGAYPSLRMVFTLGVLALLTGAASGRLLRPLHRPRPSIWSGRVLLLMGMAMPCVMSLWPLDGHVGTLPGEGVAFAIGCGRCFVFGGALGIPVLLVAIAVRRANIDGAAVAALAGVAAGLTGNLTLQVHCAVTDPHHLLVGHATLLGIFAIFAAMWRRST